MNKIILLILTLLSTISTYAQDNSELITNKLVNTLSRNEQNEIKKFILTNEELHYYNDFYGYCPFYRFNNIDAFLLPIDRIDRRFMDSDWYALYLKYNDDSSASKDNIKDIKSDIYSILEICKNSKPYNINALLTIDDFNDISDFIEDNHTSELANGALVYEVTDKDISLRLRSISWFDEETDDEFYNNTIYITKDKVSYKLINDEQDVLLVPYFETSSQFETTKKNIKNIVLSVLELIHS